MADVLPSERDQRLERILADYLHAVEAGTPPDRAKLLEQHPDLAGELRSFFRNRDAIERMAEPIKQQVPEVETIGPEGAASAAPAPPFAISATTSCWRKSPAAAWGWCTRPGRRRSTASWR